MYGTVVLIICATTMATFNTIEHPIEQTRFEVEKLLYSEGHASIIEWLSTCILIALTDVFKTGFLVCPGAPSRTRSGRGEDLQRHGISQRPQCRQVPLQRPTLRHVLRVLVQSFSGTVLLPASPFLNHVRSPEWRGVWIQTPVKASQVHYALPLLPLRST